MVAHKKAGILWFRHDLRLHDNEALHEACLLCDNVIPIYVFDERLWNARGTYGEYRRGAHKGRYIIESLKDLAHSLEARGSKLIVRFGKTEEIIYSMCSAVKAAWVFCNRERTREEVEIQDLTEEKIWSIGAEMRYYRGKMLFYTGDLPFPVPHTPDSFFNFRKEVEHVVKVRQPFPEPEEINTRFYDEKEGEWEEAVSSILHEVEGIPRDSTELYMGGEAAALRRMEHLLGAEAPPGCDELFTEDIGSLLSPAISEGCISPKLIYHSLQGPEGKKLAGKTRETISQNLVFRDYHRFLTKKYKEAMFDYEGLARNAEEIDLDKETHDNWVKGETGFFLVDALMKQLQQTGWLPNGARQYVAQYYINELEQPWLAGAEYFEYILIDYDPASNYSNWQFISHLGVDNLDHKEMSASYFLKKYDPSLEKCSYWLGRDVDSLKRELEEYKEKV